MSDIEGLPDPYEGERLDRDARLCGRAWREGWAAREAADERLREALAFYADKGNYTAQNPVGSGAHVWRDMGQRARAALAADRDSLAEKPETDT